MSRRAVRRMTLLALMQLCLARRVLPRRIVTIVARTSKEGPPPERRGEWKRGSTVDFDEDLPLLTWMIIGRGSSRRTHFLLFVRPPSGDMSPPQYFADCGLNLRLGACQR